ncbi:MAG: tetratricopeptide repeat protein [Bacteroidales bacterium]|nr:tetratricopeptide repeat protein [Bacteroidales bacterium]
MKSNIKSLLLAPIFLLTLCSAYVTGNAGFSDSSELNSPQQSNQLNHNISETIDSLLKLVSRYNNEEKISALMQFSREYSLRDPNISLSLVSKAHQLATEEGDLLQITNTLNGLSIINYYLGNNKAAMEYLLEGIESVKEILERYPDSAEFRERLYAMYNNVGNLYQSMGEMDKSLEMFQECLRMLEAQRQKFPGNTSSENLYIKALNNLIVLYWDMGEIEKAKNYLSEALDLSKKSHNNEMVYLSLNNQGLIQLEENNYKEALQTFLEIKQIHNKLNDSMGISGNYNNLGLSLFKLGRYREALSNYLASLKLTQRLGYSIGYSNTCANIAEIYMELENADSALYFSRLGIQESKQSGNKSYLLKNYEKLYQIYEHTGQYDSALAAYKNFIAVKDSMFNEEKSRQIAEMEARFETEKKEKENRILRQDLEIQGRTILLFIVSTAALLLIAILLYYFYRLKNKTLKQKTQLFEKESKVRELENARLEDQLFAEQEINKLQTEKLEQKNRELSSRILHIINKNEAMTNIINELEKIKKKQPKGFDKCFVKVNKIVKDNITIDKDWQQFKLHFEEVNPGFFQNLQQKYPQLSQNELKLCAYYRINLGTKEIAKMLNVTTSAVQKSRHRLRKKMDISSETEMPEFMSRF